MGRTYSVFIESKVDGKWETHKESICSGTNVIQGIIDYNMKDIEIVKCGEVMDSVTFEEDSFVVKCFNYLIFNTIYYDNNDRQIVIDLMKEQVDMEDKFGDKNYRYSFYEC